MSGARLEIDAEALRPLIAQIVAEVLGQLGTSGQGDDRIALLEPDAARLLSLQPHQLRDLRLAGKIKATKGPRGRALYRREDLLAYLAKSNGRK
jgi:Helix-turn-helix domain